MYRTSPRALVAAAAIATLLPSTAQATYSIVATDSNTSEVGGAGTSCVGGLSVTIIYGSEPGVGAVHAQARVNTAGRDEAVRLLGTGAAPADIIAAITAPGFDGLASDRQYGVVDLMARAAGHSGSTNGSFSSDRQGTLGPFTYSVQGNILTGVAVLDQAEAAFIGGGCDLADRLMLALEAGANNDQGDSRCTGGGIPSDSGFLRVDRPDGSQLVLIDVTDTGPQSPLPQLRTMYDTWRSQNPCPADADAGAMSGADASGAGPDGGTPPTTPDDGGCGCAATDTSAQLMLAFIVVAALLRRRRRTL